jgi:tRNA threonylcarbamoyl adenosine modification protein (Sua5/YciO/YrdC/YwlC family)
MARYFDVHPENPQPRSISQVAKIVEDGGLIVYPTDSGFALGCQLGNKEGLERIRQIRELDRHHHFTVVCSEFAQLGQFVELSNREFRAIKSVIPGPYTFILPATREVPRVMVHERKRTIGVRVPDHVTCHVLLDELGEPLVSSSLILPGEEEPMMDGWTVMEEIGHLVDAVLDSGDCGTGPTTVVNFTGDEIEIERYGAGDPYPFE